MFRIVHGLLSALALCIALPATAASPHTKKLDCTPNCPPPPNCVDPVKVTTTTQTKTVLQATGLEECLGGFVIQQDYGYFRRYSETTTLRSTLHCNGSITNQVLSVQDTFVGVCLAPLGTFCSPATPSTGMNMCPSS
jgi:hypothetical protein